MKSSLIPRLLALLLIVSVAEPCFGQKKAKDDAMTIEQIKAGVAEAKAKDKRLIVILKNGSSVSGLVSPESDRGFSVTETHGIFGDGNRVTLDYSDVSRVKGRNPLVKALKDIGTVSIIALGVAVILPLQLISGLFGHPIIPDC